MPGLDRCARCRGQLLADAAPSSPGTFMPPRPGAVTKFFRPVLYGWLRLLAKLPTKVPAAFARLFPMTDTSPEAKARMAASIIPGLGHLLDRRRRTGALVFMVWLVLLVFYLNSLARWWEWLLFGLILTMHAMAAYDAGNLNQGFDFWDGCRRRMRDMMLLSMLLCTAYLTVIFGFGAATGMRLVAAPATIPWAGVEEGDVHIFHATSGKYVPVRGDVVTAARRVVEVRAQHLIFRIAQGVPYWVVALPGDQVVINCDGITVNSRLMPAVNLPQNLPLPLEPVAMQVPDGYIMTVMSMEKMRVTLNLNTYRAIWQEVFMLQITSVQGHAVGIYLPLARRGGLYPGELAK